MKVYEFVITPRSGFGTPLMGDTFFGQFCWQLVYGAGDETVLNGLLADYAERPFIVFSDAFPRFGTGAEACNAFTRPALPLREIFNPASGTASAEMIRKRRELKARKWMVLDRPFLRQGIQESLLIDDDRLQLLLSADNRSGGGEQSISGRFLMDVEQNRNSINRLTGTTGEDGFAPYVVSHEVYAPGVRLSIFAGIDTDRISPETVASGMRQIGLTGYGKDATVGLGRFDLLEHGEVSLGERSGANACYTLSPCVPGTSWKDTFFTPFVRFGRHGGAIVTSGRNPFKAPVIMVSAGSVMIAGAGLPDSPYLGQAVTGISKAEPKTVCQGYSLFIPFRMEVH